MVLISTTASQHRPGMNHLLFVLFPGSWPKYDVDDLNMDVGSAMLARASASKARMRQGFDISFPLVTSNYPDAGQKPRYSPPPDARIHLNLLASFKASISMRHRSVEIYLQLNMLLLFGL